VIEYQNYSRKMNLEDFTAGHWQPRYQYKSFEPIMIDRQWTWNDPTINILLEKATQALGELNAFSLIVPDIDLFIEMHIAKEAQTSSRIEGTMTELDEALLTEDEVLPEKRDDWREVRNYIDAVNSAVAELNTLPLSNRLLKNTHLILMKGVRGEYRVPGEFRTSQNWIGGSGLSDAVFIPPYADSVPALMGDLEKFWHNEEIQVPHLIRAAISHYQFETIHPFLDGNGRIGRLIIPLYLISHGLLAKPSLYLSDFFERNRTSYYDALMRVRISNDLIHWVRFFLKGVAETATKGRDVFQQILSLRNQVEPAIIGLGKRSTNARKLINLLYRKPVVSAAEIARDLEISTQTANGLIRDLMGLGYLQEVTGRTRHRIYVFDPYLKLFLR
jgi:Fic family protein